MVSLRQGDLTQWRKARTRQGGGGFKLLSVPSCRGCVGVRELVDGCLVHLAEDMPQRERLSVLVSLNIGWNCVKGLYVLSHFVV
jgi:hypothetical protein